jgi:hypothetical protein
VTGVQTCALPISAVKGLWYAYVTGPTVRNLRVGTQILLGLPFSEEGGLVYEIRDDYSPTQGRIILQDLVNREIYRTYTYPNTLGIEINPATGVPYIEGDTVAQFSPLVEGAGVLDYIKDPTWFNGLLNQGIFYEIQKFFTFMVRVEVSAFSLGALLFVQQFIKRVKPTYTHPRFIVRTQLGDTEVNTTDGVAYKGLLKLFDGACTQYNDESTNGMSTMFDEPNAAGGGMKSQFDTDSDPATALPTSPTADNVWWGFDKNYLCPEDAITASASIVYAVPTTPTFDTVFSFDTQVFTDSALTLSESDINSVPAGATGLSLFHPVTIGVGTTYTQAVVRVECIDDENPVLYTIDILVNGSVEDSFSFTPPEGQSVFVFPTSVAVLATDVVTARIRHGQVADTDVLWETVSIVLGASVDWDFDDTMPAGTYTMYKVLT